MADTPKHECSATQAKDGEGTGSGTENVFAEEPKECGSCEELDFVSEGFVQAWQKGEYESSFAHLDRGDRMEALRRCFHLIPEDQKYDVFDSVFTDSEYDYGIPAKMEREIRALRPAGVLEELRRRADSEGYLTVYLGVNDWTMEVEKNMPWTLSKERAEWFARRSDLEKKARVSTAKVHLDDVITWTDSRHEDAVLLRYRNAKDISTEILPQKDARKSWKIAGSGSQKLRLSVPQKTK